MSLSVSGTSGYATTAMMNTGHRHRPDPSQLASDLFSKIDSSGKGYIDKTDLQNALNGLSSSSSSTSSDSGTASVDDIFSSLDSNGDGKVTEQEMSSSLSKIADELEAQANSSRMNQARGDMPPPPPDGADSAGLTKDQLTQMASDVQSSDSNLSSDLTQLVQNFSAADSNGDGKISMQEAMAYKQKTEAASAGATTTSDGTTSASTTSSTDTQRDAAILHRVMQLLASYRSTESASTTTASTVTTSA